MLIDTNVLVRHLTGDPPEQAVRATRLLGAATRLVVPDLVIAELVYVLTSVYRLDNGTVAALIRAVVALPSVEVADEPLLLRAVEVFEVERLHFAESYLVAAAEATGDGVVASFDRALDRATTIRRLEP